MQASFPSQKQFERFLLPPKNRSFFLFGPRGVGKSTWLQQHFANEVQIDLLETDLYLDLSRKPSLLEALIGAKKKEGTWVVIDEIQKVPLLLDEVHRLIERKKWNFALSGSSARKLKRGAANLLGGRALYYSMSSLSFEELGKERYPFLTLLETGGLPLVLQNPDQAVEILKAYVHTYLKEEIKEEGLVRRVEPFIRFLEVAGILNGQILNLEAIAQEARIPRASVEVYFSILEDTLLGVRLPAYRPGVKVREVTHSKFYWFDTGVVRAAAGVLSDPLKSLSQGILLENWILHELQIFQQVNKKNHTLSFYRTGAGTEIDFVIELQKKTLDEKPVVLTLEVKASTEWDRRWERASRELKSSQKIEVRKMLGVYRGIRRLEYQDFTVFPVEEFLRELFLGQIF